MKRKVPLVPGDELNWVVHATEFYYNKAGEVQIITQRRWDEAGDVYANDQVLAIKEVRGNGRTRYMIRDWDSSWNGSGWVVSPNNASATWTAYNGDEPAYDYEMVWNGGTYKFDAVWGTSYDLGLAQRDAVEGGASETRYFHGDHLGTTRSMSDEATPPTISPKLVYTSFGEIVSVEGTFDTRYGYVGKEGYESFAAFAPAIEFPFLHVGYRWYDPFSGRFLQRDPIGFDGGINIYAYTGNNPVGDVDPSGLYYKWSPVWVWEDFGAAVVKGAVTGGIGAAAATGGAGTAKGALVGGVAGGAGYVGWYTMQFIYVSCSDIVEAIGDLRKADKEDKRKRHEHPEVFPPLPPPPHKNPPCGPHY